MEWNLIIIKNIAAKFTFMDTLVINPLAYNHLTKISLNT